MWQFRNDYSEGAAPEVLDALIRTNGEQTAGYGEDEHCARAAELIRSEIGQPDAFVKFIPGGTAVNILAITSLTEEFEGPICAADAHPTIHETGAIEAHGRRLLATSDPFGILTPEAAKATYRDMTATGCHTTRPGMIHIADTSEFGHVYTRSEFDALCDWADEHGLAVYVDGARIASAMMAGGSDLDIRHIAARADAFTLGGTKNGMLFGEALVVNPRSERGRRAIERLPYLTKRSGALTAKGRLMGVQFEAAFDPANADTTGALPYWRYAAHADALAVKIARGLEGAGFGRYLDTAGNQQFFWATQQEATAFGEACGAETMVTHDPTDAGRTVVRFVTSWATPDAAVDDLITFAKELRG